MRKLQAFLHISADGYFSGPGGDLSWTRHDQDPEYKSGLTKTPAAKACSSSAAPPTR